MKHDENLPDHKVSAREVFGIDSDMIVPAYKQTSEHVPAIDPDYLFDKNTTLEIGRASCRERV